MELSSIKLKPSLYLRKEFAKLENQTTNLLLHPLLLSHSFFNYRSPNNAPHRRYLTDFWVCFTS